MFNYSLLLLDDISDCFNSCNHQLAVEINNAQCTSDTLIYRETSSKLE
jgi:hypothetical protein